MKDQESYLTSKEQTSPEGKERTEEQGEADEPDAPTASEENEGMSTILAAEPVLGVQSNASDE